MKDLTEGDSAVEYWIPFMKRFDKIPKGFQSAIIDEYEKAETQGRELNVEKMWDLLLAGESEARLVKMRHHRPN